MQRITLPCCVKDGSWDGKCGRRRGGERREELEAEVPKRSWTGVAHAWVLHQAHSDGWEQEPISFHSANIRHHEDARTGGEAYPRA